MDEWPTDAKWQRWLDEHASKFLLFARQKARSESDAQDLLQESIVEAARRQNGGVPPPPALVFATIHRRAIDWGRREDRRSAREFAVAEAAGTVWFDSSAEERERANLIQEAMTKLPQIYREVLTLKVWGDLTFAEIAQSLRIPPNTAASRYRYGLQELRKLTKEVLT
jgi:RNA polymerase sigma-70 factor (ECF subfamily)